MPKLDPELLRGQIAHLIRAKATRPVSLPDALALVDAMAEDPGHWAWATVLGTAQMRQAFATLTAARLAAGGAHTRQAQRAAARQTAGPAPAVPGTVAS